MSALMYNDTQINYELSNAYGKLFLNSDVALGYGINEKSVRTHIERNQDELIEGTHYIYDYAMTNGGRQRVIKWTSLGVYHLGFFIKSKQAKEFRKFMANVANTIDMFKINDKKDDTDLQKILDTLEKQNQEIQNLKNQLALQEPQKPINPFRGFYENKNRDLGQRENEFAYNRHDWMMLLNECETQLGLERGRKTKTLLISGGAK